MGDFEKKIPASACQKKKIACSTNVIESLREKMGKKYSAHQIARKKILDGQEITQPAPPPPPSKVKWSAPNTYIQYNMELRYILLNTGIKPERQRLSRRPRAIILDNSRAKNANLWLMLNCNLFSITVDSLLTDTSIRRTPP